MNGHGHSATDGIVPVLREPCPFRQGNSVAVITLIAVIALISPLAAAAQAPQGSAETSLSANVTEFRVDRYEVIGSTALDQASIDEAMKSATGERVTLPEVRRALVKLQRTYRERAGQRVVLKLQRQTLSDGVVRISVSETPVASASPAVPQTPTYDVQHFEVRGNTVLDAEELNEVLGPVAGANVTAEDLEKALRRVKALLRERGYGLATVTLPQQVLTDGTIAILIQEGPLLSDRDPFEVTPEIADVSATPEQPRFEVRSYQVIGNTLLDQATIDSALSVGTGSEVTLPQIQKALGQLQLAYRERGYATVSVGLPQQQLTNATVKVQVTEGWLADIRVTGNRYFSSNNVLRALPSLRSDKLLNSQVFQRELDLANQNRDRQIYPTIGPGPEPGTSALTLRVRDRLPLHGRAELNNHSTPGTPDWRINLSAQYNNLWQLEHQLGVSYGFSPEQFKDDGLVSDYLLNRPLISYIGAYYRMPLGAPESLEDRISSSSEFGFDEATRQFRLPPATGRPELSLIGSFSSSDTGVQLGPATVVSQTPLLTIISQDSGRNLTLNDSVGVQLSLPRPLNGNRRMTFFGGLDWKRYYVESFNTNNFLITTVITNAQGSQTIESRVESPQPVRQNEIHYLPLVVGVDYSSTDRSGTFSANLAFSGNFLGSSREFAALGYARETNAAFGKVALALTRDQRVLSDWSLLLRASGQMATGPLISNEQFALGGPGSVRGYYSGDEYGDAGWFGSIELRTPFIATRIPTWKDYQPAWFRAWVFVDAGQKFLLESIEGMRDSRFLLGAGFGASANINNAVDLRFNAGWPLTDSANTSANDPQLYFSVGGQF